MDTERSRIEEDLNGVLDGRIRCDDIFLQMYASDASIYEIRPLAVVIPANQEDVVRCMSYAYENQIPVSPRGAGSNVIGGCVGGGIVIDFSNLMRRVIQVDRETVTVEPGVVLADLNRELETHGRRFGPDPASRRVSTIGGALALNAIGSKWVRYGSPREKVLQLQVVWANGKTATLNAGFDQPADAGSETSHFEAKTLSIARRYKSDFERTRPKTKINQAGYNLFDAVRDDQVDLTRLLVGSEGTLAVITQAKLLTDPQPRHRGVCLLFFHRFEIAAQAAVEIVNMGVVACDLIDRRLLTLAAETNPDFQRIIPAEAESVLLVEVQAEDHVTLQGQLDALKYRISQRRKLTFLVRATTQKAERDLFWKLTRRIIPTLYRLRGNKRALTFIDDIAVDPVQLPKFLKVLHSTLNEFEVTASILAHAPQGAVDVRPFLDLSDPADLKTMQRLAETMLERVLEFGGTASGSCGDGLSRSWFLKRQFGDLYPAMQAIKNTFDPSNILNPGKKIPTGDQHVAHRVRLVKVPQPQISVTTPGSDSVLRVLQPQMPWGIDDVAQAARNCNGCGRCRTGLAEERMCPIFRLEPREESSPRAKANLMRGIVTAQLPAQTITADHFKEIADLCFNCHQCRLDCPASVDIPRLVMEAKANHYAVNGCRFSDWLLTRLDWLYDTAGRMPRLANSCIKSPLARGILDRFFGIARSRKLPRFDSKRFSRWVSQNRLDRPSKRQALKVCYFADAYVAWNDGELGQALVNVFKHNGIDVLVPARQGISAMSLISEGAIGPARKIAARNVEALAEYVRQGYQVITSEPSATLALKHEYLNILDDNDTRLVAENTIDACTLLLQLHGAGELKLDFAPQNVRVGYHLPCHQRVFSKFPPAVQLLQLVPGLQIDHLDKGCSGMAGTWGLKPRNLGDSLKIGFGLMNAVQESTIDIGSTECSACKIQMEHGTPKPTIHPVKVLAKAYGLMPELSDLYRRRSGELTTT